MPLINSILQHFHKIFILSFLLVFFSCQKKSVDKLFYNGKIYSVDSSFTVVEAMAIKDGKIVAMGTNAELKNYDASERIDLNGAFVYPGFIDAHCHFYGYGVDLKKIDLTGTVSWNAVLDSLVKYRDKKFMGWIFGRGWDQNDWETKNYPDKAKLDRLFPDVPVFLIRIDGHAAVVNQKALDLAGIGATTKVTGGEIEVVNGKLSGLLIDNAVDLVKLIIPEPSSQAKIEALLAAQKNCFQVGLTTVDDAGLDKETILLIDSLHKSEAFKMRYYAMITYNDSNKSYFFKNGKIKTDRLNVCSFKIYADGALGSRGALLLAPYSDKEEHSGSILTPIAEMEKAAIEIAQHDFQLCTHCIGDSANRLLLQIYGAATKNKTGLRWRIEHAQVVDDADVSLFKSANCIPSVQPTHATSDMYWAESRLSKKRLYTAYAYNKLLKTTGILALGSDFPVESINPLYGFYAATVRKDKNNFPENGFQKENAITREQALRGMTIWAAYANFEEKEKGSLEIGKYADFVVLKEDLMLAPDSNLWKIKVHQTFINGENVFKQDEK
jgi:predicted amidohydrolase YtcJ